jgi:hypothetical protein
MSWLDAMHLGRIEAAGKGVDTELATRCWWKLAALELDIKTQRPWLLHTRPRVAACNGKEALKALMKLSLQLNTIPEAWSPEIQGLSPTSLQVSPTVVDVDDNTIDDELPPLIPVSELEDEEDMPPPLIMPSFCPVPLALGINLGQEMSVGVHIKSETVNANEGVWFGLDITGMEGDCGKVMSLLCAPLTGRCMMKFPDFPSEPKKLIAQALPPVADGMCDSVEIFVTVSKWGDVEFMRISKASNVTARSGKMRLMFPTWASHIFASIHVEREQAFSKTTVVAKLPMDRLLQDQDNKRFQQATSELCELAKWSLEVK